MKRTDDFKTRREHLKNLSDEELYQKFWQLAEQVVDPMLEMGKKYTTPAIERSILLRMGFSSVEAKPLVEGMMKHELMGKGSGNVIWKLSQKKGISIREAGLALIDGKYWAEVPSLFDKGGVA